MRRRGMAWFFLICMGCSFWATAGADEPTILRYTSYVLIETGGKPASVTFESRPYGSLHKDFVYQDQPGFTVIGADGQVIEEIDGRLGIATTINIPAVAGNFVIIETRSGNNYCVIRSENPYACIATETAALNTVRGFDRLYFFVPKGLDAASIFFHAFSVNEAARVLICNPDGTPAFEGEDDFNTPVAESFQVLDGQDGKVWSLSLLPPKRPDWKVDDCKLWMSGSLPGILAPKPEWAERLSRPFVINWRRVEDFESADPVRQTQGIVAQWERPAEKGAQAPSLDMRVAGEQPHTGKQSLRVEMKLPEHVAVANQLKIFLKPMEAGTLERVRFWLYGDGSGRKLTVRVRDQDNVQHYYDAGTINWKGWGEVVADFLKKGQVKTSGGSKPIAGPKVTVVIHIGHEEGQPTHSVYYVDDLAVSP